MNQQPASGDNDAGGSLGVHRSKVFGIHEQYPEGHPSDVTRALHNSRQAAVFDEQARCVCIRGV